MKQILISIVLLFLILCFASKKHETIERAKILNTLFYNKSDKVKLIFT